MNTTSGSPMTRYRRLSPEDAEAYFELRREALLREPLAFAMTIEEERDLPALRETLQPDGRVVIFGAHEAHANGAELVGTVGLYRDPLRKAAHKVHLWGFYVRAEHRSRGVGASLLEAALSHARNLEGVTQVQLSVTERAAGARRLYVRLGFVLWGTEPNALRWEGEAVAEHYMVLPL